MNEQEGKKRKIAIIAGSRGEYGYFRPIIREIISRPTTMDYGIIVTNMHLLDTFGSTVDEMKKDNFKIYTSIYNTFDGYNNTTMVKSLGIFLLQLPEVMNQMGADIILLSGDRGEQLMAAIVGAHMNIPVAHIQAGEVSGNIDGVTRHAITKYAHLHFTSNEDAAERVKRLGEETHRIHNVGAPMLDELMSGQVTPPEQIYEKFGLQRNQPIMLLVYHSVVEDVVNLEWQMDELMGAVTDFGFQTVVILNNADAGGNIIRRKMTQHKKPYMKIHKNVSREDYAGIMSVANVMVGNSSSGLIEAPVFGLPAVNVGNRQQGRTRGDNVIDVGHEKAAIINAIKQALEPSFREQAKLSVNPYGDGKSAKRVVDILESVKIDSRLLTKKMTY